MNVVKQFLNSLFTRFYETDAEGANEGASAFISTASGEPGTTVAHAVLRNAADRRAKEVANSSMQVLRGDEDEIDERSILARAIAASNIADVLYATEYDLYAIGQAAWRLVRPNDGIDGMFIQRIKNPHLATFDFRNRDLFMPETRERVPLGDFVLFARFDRLSATARLNGMLSLYNAEWDAAIINATAARSPKFVMEWDANSFPTPEQQKEYNEKFGTWFNTDRNQTGQRSIFHYGGSAKRMYALENPVDQNARYWIQEFVRRVSVDSGVPPYYLGVEDDPTYLNAEAFDKRFILGTIEAQTRMMAQNATQQFSDAYFPVGGGKVEIKYLDAERYMHEDQRIVAQTTGIRAAAIRSIMQADPTLTIEQAIVILERLEGGDDAV